ncbi:acetyl-CoA carboxylase biotin carboxyl carrier protein [Botrimarina mediterranea]|uniref:Biotin carboxyl carrier protein of acetyl-CoA carboxylase n=1 Tax=Botrimarina mediterranea TaxID=2528022 RepID=A0A518K9D7_9BACT|nr:acetyl-CoA carboxylase biotin carboxyl carrier protein [Botrimarina mediterranea]QDV74402.1 Acetyl-CoA biotin carboxyl carrier [Botrimarina mediterranea]QDV78998.1 Acetyl-CoA biotin carboxyl carrier [Planctomycetes bacterium K2D]
MAEDSKQDPTEAQDVFDVRRVRRLVALMNEHDLSEIDLRQGNQRVRLRRGADQPVFTATPAYAPAAAPAPAPQAAPAPAAAPSAPAAAPAGKTINSPMVGTFYLSSSPDAAPFIKIGDQVGPDTTICIIEAMKVFNEIPAETSGKITAVLVENGMPVEFGQPLFRIE